MEPKFNVGDRVILVTKNGTKEPTRITNVFKVDGGYVYKVKSRKNPVPEDRLEHVDFDEGFGPIEFTPDFEFDLEMGVVMLFETGDVVEVDDYPGQRFIVDSYTVLMRGKTTDKNPDIDIEWLLLDENYPYDERRAILAYEDEMRKVSSGGRKTFNPFRAPAQIARGGGRIYPASNKTEKKDGTTDEIRRLAQLDKYRELVERTDKEITDNMSLFAVFGDEKYKRKADRLKTFRDRIPTRGYQFE